MQTIGDLWTHPPGQSHKLCIEMENTGEMTEREIYQKLISDNKKTGV